MTEETFADKLARRALSSGLPVPMTQEEIDNAKASMLIPSMYSGQRKLINNRVEVACMEINAGGFSNGSLIVLAWDPIVGHYVIIDGQHRVTAQTIASRPTIFSFIVDQRMAPDAYSHYDTIGKTRTLKDRVSPYIDAQFQAVPAIIRAVAVIHHKFDPDVLSSKKTVYTQIKELSHLVSEYQDAANWLTNHVPSIKFISKTGKPDSKKQFNRSAIACVLLVAIRYQPEIAKPLILSAASNDGLAKNSPEKMLYNTSMMPAKDYAEQKMLMNISAGIFNAKFMGRDEMRSMPNSNVFPGIAGTPYAK